MASPIVIMIFALQKNEKLLNETSMFIILYLPQKNLLRGHESIEWVGFVIRY